MMVFITDLRSIESAQYAFARLRWRKIRLVCEQVYLQKKRKKMYDNGLFLSVGPIYTSLCVRYQQLTHMRHLIFWCV